MASRQVREYVQVNDERVLVTRKSMKNVRVRVVPPEGAVEVSAPYSVSADYIRHLVESRWEWILRQRVEVKAAPSSEAERASTQQQAEWRAVVEACVPPLVAEWERVLGVRVKTLVFRNMKTRWGSCQPSTGRVCINTRLALYPPECLEYVVVHELCHFLEPNHGPGFKKLMTKVMPDWPARKAKLQ